MPTTTLLFKTDKRLKEEAQTIVHAMGIPLSAYLNAQLRQLVNSRRVIFDAPEIPNQKTALLVKRALEDARCGKNMSGPHHSGKELDEYLMSLE